MRDIATGLESMHFSARDAEGEIGVVLESDLLCVVELLSFQLLDRGDAPGHKGCSSSGSETRIEIMNGDANEFALSSSS